MEEMEKLTAVPAERSDRQEGGQLNVKWRNTSANVQPHGESI